MQAIHDGKAKHDPIDAQKIAALLRGGMLPQAYVYPAEMRATRDLLRRRTHLRRTRAALLAPVQQTNSQDHLPELGQKIASTANRTGVAERCDDPAVPKNIAVDLGLITYDDALLTDRERSIVKPATHHDAHTFYRLGSIPGVGNILALVRLYEIHDIHRFPSVQDCVSYGRLVKCARASAGTRDGTSGKNIGNAHLKWAFSEAAVLFLRHHPAGQQHLASLANTHGKGKALTVLAHKLARAVYDMLTRDTVFNMDQCLTG
jgi:transposase